MSKEPYDRIQVEERLTNHVAAIMLVALLIAATLPIISLVCWAIIAPNWLP